MKKIYIAGPDVFFENSIQIGKTKKDLCLKYGFEGIYPLDLLPEDLFSNKYTSSQQAKIIKNACVKGIKDCDILIANMTPFRGVSMDVGTANEIGLAHMIDKDIYGYSLNSKSYLEKLNETNNISMSEKSLHGETFYDNDKSVIENFDKIDNCMVTESCSKIFFPENDLENNISLFEKVLIELQIIYND